MKKPLIIAGLCAAIFSLFTFINSCSKLDQVQTLASRNSKPNVPQCPPGQHWDYKYGRCVPNDPGCAAGFHWDPNAGGCVPDNPAPPPSDSIIIITNLNNPYDYTGADHNGALNAIFPNINPLVPNLDSVIEAQVKNYAVSIWGDDPSLIQILYDTLYQRWNFPASLLPEMDTVGNELYARGLISNKANYYLQRIDSIGILWLNVDNPSSLLYNSFANSLISLEAQVMNDNILTSDERELLLSSCSIARYSAAYWGNYINNQISPMLNQPLFLKDLFKKKWFRIVVADAVGAWGGIKTFHSNV
ncbi:MAG: hypothetical protein ACRDE2_11480 [Chitinophagaceae bacterium]